jgi:pimeloyl-ACP methyl ester carboxylesterase
MTEPTPLAAFGRLRLPVLLMTGKRSTAAAHGVARRLAKVLPNVTCIEIPGLGHMGPITHAQQVNAEIVRFVVATT